VIGHELRGDPIDAARAFEVVPDRRDRLSAGYSRSVYNVLSTFSFGVGVNVSSFLKRPSKE